ncbi:hypothetical protein EMCRGX_G003148 [Ephydatia muelleri]
MTAVEHYIYHCKSERCHFIPKSSNESQEIVYWDNFCEAIQAVCWLERTAGSATQRGVTALKPVNYCKERPVLWKSDVTTSPSTAGRFILLSTFYCSCYIAPDKTGSTGWNLKVELQSFNSIATCECSCYVALDKMGSTGWNLKEELQSFNSIATYKTGSTGWNLKVELQSFTSITTACSTS